MVSKYGTVTQCRSSVSIGQVSSAVIRWSQVKEEKANMVNDRAVKNQDEEIPTAFPEYNIQLNMSEHS